MGLQGDFWGFAGVLGFGWGKGRSKQKKRPHGV